MPTTTNKGKILQQKLKAKLVRFGITATRIRPFYKSGSTSVSQSSITVKLLDAANVGKRYQDINRFTDVGTLNNANQDLTIYYADGTVDISEGDILTYSQLPFRMKVDRVHPFVLEDVIVYLEVTAIRENQVGVTI